ncbi:unnamed protein product [Brachionus calyciflorus]|uniref:Phospholipid/glycerol acyltransferase domain-containing protein n=1 Tax=Brachionus calyciflorus TaxID=104777 RepID=A0A813X5A3_9BILA|nr:unnamed protein product [Brachionus calyciflorus]
MIFLMLIPCIFTLVFTPICMVIHIIFATTLLYIYKKININKYSRQNTIEFWNKPCELLANIWYKFGRIYHGYEIDGIENIPKNGPAILILFHPPAPIDAPFIFSNIFFKLKRKIITVVLRMNFKMPGYKIFAECVGYIPGSRESCISLLKNGEIILIYPGGSNEGMQANDYELLWKPDAGFAKVAQQAKVPVIPVFTKNTREVHWILQLPKSIFKIPLGWLPVKLKSYIGEPILYDENRTVQELVSLTKSSIEKLIKKHQLHPRSIVYSLLERFMRENKKIN